jgi:hypothetical protein
MRVHEDHTLGAHVDTAQVLPQVTGGSALLKSGPDLMVVHDDAFRVTCIALPSFAATPRVLVGEGSSLGKTDKPDFEAAVQLEDGSAVLLGSGSTPMRCKLAYLDLVHGTVRIVDRPDLYDVLWRGLRTEQRPNIEGAIADRRRVLLFHRGSGGAPGAILELPADALRAREVEVVAVRRVELGRLDDVTLGFTDAALLPDGRVMFLAAAEDSPDAITDGRVTGSVLGVLDAALTEARWTRICQQDGEPYRHKAEGLVVDADAAAGWILTDADDPGSGAELGRLALRGFI